MNFIYFNPDEMRADALGCYGNGLVQTPHFDRLAAEGVRFDQCHVQHTVCSPSRCSFTTGWYPHTRGHRSLWHLLQPDEPNTLRYMKDAGYDVRYIGKNDLYAEASIPLAISRRHAVTETAPHGERLFRPGEPGFHSFLHGPMDGHYRDYYSVEEAIRILKARQPGDPPLFLFIASGFPHCPYTCPQPWYDMVDPDDLPPLRSAECANKPVFHRLIREYRDLDKVDESVLRKIMAVYLGMSCYVDHLLGRLLAALDETGLAEETALLAFSDHGDWAGDYGLVEKWPSGLDDCLTRVPLLVRAPGCARGHVVREPVELFDIVPTTLSLAGLEARHSHHAVNLHPQLLGEAGDPDRAAFAEGGYDPFEPQCFEGNPEDHLLDDPERIYYPKAKQQQDHPESVCRSVMVRTATHKLIRRTNGDHELYDLRSDPREEVNLYGAPQAAEAQNRLRERLLDWYLRTSDVTPFHRDYRGFPDERK